MLLLGCAAWNQYLQEQGSLRRGGAGAGAAPGSHPGRRGGLVSQRRRPQAGLDAVTLCSVLGLGRTKAQHMAQRAPGLWAGCCPTAARSTPPLMDPPSKEDGPGTAQTIISSPFATLPSPSSFQAAARRAWVSICCYSRPLPWLQAGILAGRNHLFILTYL